MVMSPRRLRTFVSLLPLLLVLTPPRFLEAAIFNIANGDVAGLIAAINTANGNGEANIINLATNRTYNLTAADNDSNGLPVITNPLGLTINGNGSTIARTGASTFRFFQVNAGAFIVNSLTLTGGNVPTADGGAILVTGGTGPLTITNSTSPTTPRASRASAATAGRSTTSHQAHRPSIRTVSVAIRPSAAAALFSGQPRRRWTLRTTGGARRMVRRKTVPAPETASARTWTSTHF